jgi:drug/metabolite transporter (DMT)-like permease
MATARRIHHIGALAIVLAAVLWSLDGFLRQNLSGVASLYIVFLEHAIGAVLFAPFLIRGWAEVRTLSRRSWISVLWVAISGGLAGTFFYTKALSYTNYIDLSVVVLLQKFQPLFAIVLAAILLGEAITHRFLIYAGLAVVGGYLITFREGLPNFGTGDGTWIASLLALAAAFAWGSSTVLGKYALKDLSFFTLASLRLWITAAFAAPILLVLPSGSGMALTPPQWWIVLAIVLSTGSVAVFIYYFGLKRVPASHATLYELFWPLSAVLIDWLVNDRFLSPTQIIGAILLISVSILLSRGAPGRVEH